MGHAADARRPHGRGAVRQCAEAAAGRRDVRVDAPVDAGIPANDGDRGPARPRHRADRSCGYAAGGGRERNVRAAEPADRGPARKAVPGDGEPGLRLTDVDDRWRRARRAARTDGGAGAGGVRAAGAVRSALHERARARAARHERSGGRDPARGASARSEPAGLERRDHARRDPR